jgi:hypothetical protein
MRPRIFPFYQVNHEALLRKPDCPVICGSSGPVLSGKGKIEAASKDLKTVIPDKPTKVGG